jgi:hypothetical protein
MEGGRKGGEAGRKAWRKEGKEGMMQERLIIPDHVAEFFYLPALFLSSLPPSYTRCKPRARLFATWCGNARAWVSFVQVGT